MSELRLITIPDIGKAKKEEYESLASEVVNDAIDRGDEEHATGVVGGIPYEIKAEWRETCCVSLYCPGLTELKGKVRFTENGMWHYIDFSDAGHFYRHSRFVRSDG